MRAPEDSIGGGSISLLTSRLAQRKGALRNVALGSQDLKEGKRFTLRADRQFVMTQTRLQNAARVECKRRALQLLLRMEIGQHLLQGSLRPRVVYLFAVKQASKQEQTITFASLPDKLLGDPPFTASATASSGLPVSFASATPGVCLVSGNTVTLVTTGVCSLTATQNGDAAHNPATPVTQSFAIK